MDAFSPQRSGDNHYYYYYNTALLPHNPNPQDDIHNMLTYEGKLNIQKPEPFYGSKLFTFQLESSCIAFTTLYLQSIAFDHYTVLLQFNSNSLVLSNWQVFTQEFSSKFGVFNTVAEADENLFNLQICNNEWFTTFIIHFEKEAYEIGWNYNALQIALYCALLQFCLTLKQPNYDGYKALVTQIDQWY
ncbi:hypothetical protein C0993_004790 [Termitomyces sp. T159_Od127]|nr:hypothetical protein C0993_004790 [Termitomyces sp. T159_Od127]